MKILIKLNKKTEVPSGAFIVSEKGSFKRDTFESPGDFAAPWWQKPDGFRDPPIMVSNGGLENTQLSAGILMISFEGDIYVDPQHLKRAISQDGAKKTMKRIKKDIDSLCALWEWGLEIRSEQDQLLEEVRALLPGWEINLPEEDRIFFNHSKIGEIKEWLKTFSEAEEKVSAGLKCSVGKVSATLEKEWRETKTVLNEEAQKSSHKDIMEKRFQDIQKDREQILPVLKKAGLI